MQNQTPAIGDNRGPALDDMDVAPDDYGARMPRSQREAIKFFWTYYCRIMADRRVLSETRTAQAKDAATHYGIKPAVVRLGYRFARMTPEQLQAHADAQNTMLGLFGYSPLGVADTHCADENMRRALDLDKFITEQQRQLSKAMKQLIAAAKERQVDVEAVAELYKFNRSAGSKNGGEDEMLEAERPDDLLDRMQNAGYVLGVFTVN